MLRVWCICTRVGSLDSIFFFFNDPATTEIYTLSLPDALPISGTFTCNADTNGDLTVDGLDAQAFVTLVVP